MKKINLPVHAIAHARAGDKGDVSNISLIAYLDSGWKVINDLATEETFVNNDGTPFDYDNWRAGEPDNVFGEDCVITGDNWGKEWIDTGCGGPNNRYFGMLLVPDPIGDLTCVEYVGK